MKVTITYFRKGSSEPYIKLFDDTEKAYHWISSNEIELIELTLG